jgi:hypothetical protein
METVDDPRRLPESRSFGGGVSFHGKRSLCHDCGAACDDLLCKRCKRLMEQNNEINALVLALRDVTADMWGNVDSDDVLVHTTDGARHVNPKTAKAFWVAANLLAKYGDAK